MKKGLQASHSETTSLLGCRRGMAPGPERNALGETPYLQ